MQIFHKFVYGLLLESGASEREKYSRVRVNYGNWEAILSTFSGRGRQGLQGWQNTTKFYIYYVYKRGMDLFVILFIGFSTLNTTKPTDKNVYSVLRGD